MPVAVSCCVVLTAKVVTSGERVIPVRLTLALLTDSVPDPVFPPLCAVTVALPEGPAVAIPAAVIDTTAESVEPHVADAVRSFVLPSE